MGACSGCELLASKPTENIETSADDEVLWMADEIESLAAWDAANLETDWTIYPFEYKRLFVEYRQAEREFASYERQLLLGELKKQTAAICAAHGVKFN